MPMPNIHDEVVSSFPRGRAGQRGVVSDPPIYTVDPLPEGVVDLALANAISLLGPDDRKLLEVSLREDGDLVLDEVFATVPALPTAQELAINLAVQIAKAISNRLKTLALPLDDPAREVAAAVEIAEAGEEKNPGGIWSKIKGSLDGLAPVQRYKAWRKRRKEAAAAKVEAERLEVEKKGKEVITLITDRFNDLFAAQGLKRDAFIELYKENPELAESLLATAMTREATAQSISFSGKPNKDHVRSVYERFGPIVVDQLGNQSGQPAGWQKEYGYRFATHITDSNSAAQVLSSGKLLPQKWGIFSGAIPQLIESVKSRREWGNILDNMMNKTRSWVFASDNRLGLEDITWWDAKRSSILLDVIEKRAAKENLTPAQVYELRQEFAKGKLKTADAAVSVMVPAERLTPPTDWKAADYGLGHEVATMLQGVDLYGSEGTLKNLSEAQMINLRNFVQYKGTVGDKAADGLIAASFGGAIAAGGLTAGVLGAVAMASVLGIGFPLLFAALPRLLNWPIKGGVLLARSLKSALSGGKPEAGS